jgi:hypothetical protein
MAWYSLVQFAETTFSVPLINTTRMMKIAKNGASVHPVVQKIVPQYIQ